MPEISNPTGAFKRSSIASFTFPVTDAGEMIYAPGEVRELQATAAVNRGDCIAYVLGTATAPLGARQMTSADNNLLFAGIAINAAAIGQVVQVVTSGLAIARVGNVAVTGGGSYITRPTTAGTCVVSAVAIDATTVLGTVFGKVMSSNLDSSNTFVLVDVGQM